MQGMTLITWIFNKPSSTISQSFNQKLEQRDMDSTTVDFLSNSVVRCHHPPLPPPAHTHTHRNTQTHTLELNTRSLFSIFLKKFDKNWRLLVLNLKEEVQKHSYLIKSIGILESKKHPWNIKVNHIL